MDILITRHGQTEWNVLKKVQGKADIDLNNYDVVTELKKWGKWYTDLTALDGFRLDAVKHIRADFTQNG